jgi:NADPH2:quinone reductase
MKAWVQYKTGGVDVLDLAKITTPEPGPMQVLVRNRAVGLNPVDWKFVEWGHPDWIYPHISGVDGAGEIATVGKGITHLTPGMRVAYHQNLVHQGSFAEYTVIPAYAAIPLPDGLSFEAAATIPCPGLTAWQAIEKVNIPAGSRVLLTGASGAVGGALLQLARSRGWTVHAAASPNEHRRVLKLGAAEAIDYKQADWIARLQTLSSVSPFRAVFDVVSGAHAAKLAALLGVNGHLVCVQDRQEKPPFAPFTTTLSLHEVGLNAMHRHGADKQQWGDLVTAGAAIGNAILTGQFDPQIIEVAPFSELPQALDRLRKGPNPGNRVVTLSSE